MSSRAEKHIRSPNNACTQERPGGPLVSIDNVIISHFQQPVLAFWSTSDVIFPSTLSSRSLWEKQLPLDEALLVFQHFKSFKTTEQLCFQLLSSWEFPFWVSAFISYPTGATILTPWNGFQSQVMMMVHCLARNPGGPDLKDHPKHGWGLPAAEKNSYCNYRGLTCLLGV